MRFWMAAVLACLGLVSSSLAETVRRDFLPDANGFAENPLVEGRVSFKIDHCRQQTNLRLNIEGLLPNTTYGVLWQSDGPWLDNPAAFTTDEDGEGRYVDYQIGDASIDPVVFIYIDDPNSGNLGSFDPGEQRAFSYIPFTRIRCFQPKNLGLTQNPHVDGMATIRFTPADGLTTFHLIIHDLRPNTTYGVKFESEDGPQLDNPAAFTTNRRGNGKYDDYLIGLSTRNVVMSIYVDSAAGALQGEADPEEVRASGTTADNGTWDGDWDD